MSGSVNTIATLLPAISACLLKDQFRLRRRLQQCKTLPAAAQAEQLARIASDIARSADLCEQRRQAVPAISYPALLPVAEKKDEIKAAIAANQVVIIAGETGSGKTTQIPKICLELGRGVAGMIGHTQPRRLAARSVCDRIAEELQCQVGAQ
ncbi:MAG: ATP-dependent RNA helicase HrpA, partial [Rheinheimera sp.]|nr:ATP-dependent RNA helicase HrpA [Rheinheimera sp.]